MEDKGACSIMARPQTEWPQAPPQPTTTAGHGVRSAIAVADHQIPGSNVGASGSPANGSPAAAAAMVTLSQLLLGTLG